MRRARVPEGQLRLDFWRGRVVRRAVVERPAPVEPPELRAQVTEDERICRRLHLWRGRPSLGRIL